MTEKPSSKDHFSNTQLEMAFMCGERYRRRYVEGERIPPGIAMLRGTGIHTAAKTNFTQKIKSHADLPKNQIVDAAVAAFDAEIAGGGIALDEEEQARGLKVVIGETRDDVADMAEVHAEMQAPDYQPVLVEHSINVEMPGSRSLLAIIDMADDEGRVVDFKTSKRSKSQADADVSMQLSVYDVAYEAETGEKPSEMRLDTVVQTKRETKRQVLTTYRDDVDRAALAARIDAAAKMVEAGVFPPATPGAWWCSAKFCGYFNNGCKFVNPSRGTAQAD